MKINNKPIFIVGPPRSGTTLLRLMLNKHPAIAIPEETGFLHHIFKNYNVKIETIKSQLCSDPILLASLGEDIISKVKERKFNSIKELVNECFYLYTKKERKIFWGEKTPLHYMYIPELKILFPDSLVIFMVRDPRAVISSYLRYSHTGEFWAKKNIEEAITFYLEAILRAIVWRNHLFVLKYEDLVENPKKSLKKILNRLNLSYSKEMENFYLDAQEHIRDKIGGRLVEWHKDLKNPINKANSNKWEKELDQEKVRKIETELYFVFKIFGYKYKTFSLTTQNIQGKNKVFKQLIKKYTLKEIRRMIKNRIFVDYINELSTSELEPLMNSIEFLIEKRILKYSELKKRFVENLDDWIINNLWYKEFLVTISANLKERNIRLWNEKLTLAVYRIASFCEKFSFLNEAKRFFLMLKKSGAKNYLDGVLYHLGEISKKEGNLNDAKRYFKECLRINKLHRMAKEELKKIK